MKKAKKFKIISILLTISLFLTGVPVSAIGLSNDSKAENLNPNNSTVQTYTKADILTQEELSQYVQYESAQSLGHVKLLEQTENTLTYLNYDNTKTLYYYGTDIAYLDSNGKLVEKDITLQANTNQSAYSMKSNDIQTILPQNISEGVSITHNGKSATLTPIFSNNQQQLAVNADNIPLVSASASLNSQENAITYSSTFGNSTSITYTPLLNGIKEDIILQQYTGISEFSFLLETNGMGVYYDEEAELFYTASAEDVQDGFVIGRIYVYDNSDKLEIGTTTITILEENEKYLLTISVNPEFLSASDTVYPVTIDPTLTINQPANIEDAITYSNYPNNSYGGYQYAYIGNYNNYGIGQLLVRFPNLNSDSTWNAMTSGDITSAYYYMYCGTSSAASSIQPHLYWGNTWTESGVKYSNINWAEVYPHSMPSTNIPTTAGNYGFNITGTVKSWKEGMASASLGLVFKNTDETTSTKVKCFRTKEYANAHSGATMPYLVINYNSSTPPVQTVELETGYYFIKNHSNKYIDAANSGTTNGTDVLLWDVHFASNQRWYIQHMGNGYYLINPAYTTLVLGAYNGSSPGTQVKLCTYTVNDTHTRWKITQNSDGCYSFSPECNPNTSLAYESNTTGSNLCIQSTSSSLNSHWRLERAYEMEIDEKYTKTFTSTETEFTFMYTPLNTMFYTIETTGDDVDTEITVYNTNNGTVSNSDFGFGYNAMLGIQTLGNYNACIIRVKKGPFSANNTFTIQIRRQTFMMYLFSNTYSLNFGDNPALELGSFYGTQIFKDQDSTHATQLRPSGLTRMDSELFYIACHGNENELIFNGGSITTGSLPDMSHTKLAVFAACYSDNIARAAVDDKNCQSAIGWETDVHQGSIGIFTSSLFSNLRKGQTFDSAKKNALRDIANPYDAVHKCEIYGNDQVVIYPCKTYNIDEIGIQNNPNTQSNVNNVQLIDLNNLTTQNDYFVHTFNSTWKRYYKTFHNILSSDYYDVYYDENGNVEQIIKSVDTITADEIPENSWNSFSQELNLNLQLENKQLVETTISDMFAKVDAEVIPVRTIFCTYENEEGFRETEVYCYNMLNGSSIDYSSTLIENN